MSILTHLKQNFDIFLKNSFSKSDDYCLKLISKLLEECDLELAAIRNKSLEIVKKVSRTILTSKGQITFKQRYYYNTIDGTYTYLLDTFLRIPKYFILSNELKIKILSSLDHLSYEAAGKDNLPDGYEISVVSVLNLLNKSSIEVEYKPFKVSNKVIHVQIDKSYYTLYSLFKENSDAIKRWFNKDYLSCSQECINSHYFANRLDKKPNTFTTASCDKLCDLINAIHNNLSFKIDTHESYYDIPIQCCLPSYNH